MTLGWLKFTVTETYFNSVSVQLRWTDMITKIFYIKYFQSRGFIFNPSTYFVTLRKIKFDFTLSAQGMIDKMCAQNAGYLPPPLMEYTLRQLDY